MFGLLQYDSVQKDIRFVRREDPTRTGAAQHAACDYCRLKKLRCSGDTTGCTRCKALSRECAYTMSGQVKGRAPRATIKKNPSRSSITLSSAHKDRDMRGPSARNLLESDQASEDQVNSTTANGTVSLEPGRPDEMRALDADMLWDMERLDHIIDGVATFTQDDADAFSPLYFPLLSPDITSNITPRVCSSSESTTLSTDVNLNSKTYPCTCLCTVLLLVEDVEETLSSLASTPLSSLLAAGKGSLTSLSRLFVCIPCMERTEILMLLVFLSEKLVLIAIGIIDEYTRQTGAVISASNSNMPFSLLSTKYSTTSTPAQQNTCEMSSSSVMVGEYEISSQQEWRVLLHALIRLQLQSLKEFLFDLAVKARGVLPGSQSAKLGLLTENVAVLSGKMDSR